MQGYVKLLENEIEQRAKLIEVLENGQTFYEVQNDDAMVVANVSSPSSLNTWMRVIYYRIPSMPSV